MARSQDQERTILLDARAMSRALQRMAVEIVELSGTDDLVLIGIQRRGVELAQRIARLIEQEEGGSARIRCGSLDITLYRDDLETVGPKPVIGETHIPGARIAVVVIAIAGDRARPRSAIRRSLRKRSITRTSPAVLHLVKAEQH